MGDSFVSKLSREHPWKITLPSTANLARNVSQLSHRTEVNGFTQVWHRLLWRKGQDELMQINRAEEL